jgi:hypothetical protein
MKDRRAAPQRLSVTDANRGAEGNSSDLQRTVFPASIWPAAGRSAVSIRNG